MEIQDVTKPQKKEIVLTLRTTKEKYKFLKDNKISPARLFNKAIDEIMATPDWNIINEIKFVEDKQNGKKKI